MLRTIIIVVLIGIVTSENIVTIKPEETANIFLSEGTHDKVDIFVYSDNKLNFTAVLWSNDMIITILCDKCVYYSDTVFLDSKSEYTLKINNNNMFYDNIIVYDVYYGDTVIINILIILIFFFLVTISLVFCILVKAKSKYNLVYI